MSGFRFDKSEDKPVHISGKDFIAREPSLDEQIQYERAVKSAESGMVIEVVLDYLDSLGVEKEYVKKMPQAKIMDLLAYISSPLDKKK